MTLCRRQLDIKMHHPKHVHFKGQWHWGVFSGHSPKDSSRNSRHVPKMIPRRLPAGWYSSTKCAVGCINVSHMSLLGLHHAIIPILPAANSQIPNFYWLLPEANCRCTFSGAGWSQRRAAATATQTMCWRQTIKASRFCKQIMLLFVSCNPMFAVRRY